MVSAACRGLPSCALCLPVTFFIGALNCSVTNRQCRIPLCLVSAFFVHAGSRSFDRRSLSFCCGAAATFHARFMKTASEGLFSSSFSRLESNKAGLRLAGWLAGCGEAVCSGGCPMKYICTWRGDAAGSCIWLARRRKNFISRFVSHCGILKSNFKE